jgi:predicted RNA-binding protein (virulence factor B family)
LIAIGKKQFFKVDHEDKSGYYLRSEEGGEVFMPGTLSHGNHQVGAKIEVFVYLDGDGNALATANLPDYEVGDFACLKVMSVTPHGAFLDMGIPKDILVPRKLQKYEMKKGETHLVMILLEEGTNRIFGTSKIEPYVLKSSVPFRPKQSVSIIPYHKTPLGYKVLIEKSYLGMVYHNEIYTNVEIGRVYQGSVKMVRDDGSVDAFLQEVGTHAEDAECSRILEALIKANGRIEITDKSPAEEVEKKLSMSKNAFKRAVGILYKEKKIRLGPTYIELA